MEFHLTDGTPVRVRPILPADKRLLQLGLRELSQETIQRRFLGAKPHFTSAELRYLTEVDGHDHLALVAELAQEPHRMVGVARFVRLREEPDTAEMAILVTDDFQGRGAGSALAELLAQEALAHGVRRFTATTASDNVAVQRLLARLARHMEHRHDGFGADSVLVNLAAA
jgi:RimJ/RimL family protein N-acetyltransferase